MKNSAKLVARAARAAILPGRARAYPPYLVFFVTDRCNARCSFCFNRERSEQADAEAELGPDEVGRTARGWRGITQVTLTGGEPFLRGDLPEVALAWADAGARSITIATNGVLTGRIESGVRRILDSKPDLFLDLDISIDGPEELHDGLRGLSGCYEKAMQSAKRLESLHRSRPGFRLGATLTLSRLNQHAALDTMESLVRGGLFQRIQVVLVRGRPFDPEAAGPDLEVYKACCELLSAGPLPRGGSRIREALSAGVRETVLRTAEKERMVLPCLAGRTMVTLDPYGEVFPCEVLWQTRPDGDPGRGIGSWSMGSLKESDFSIERVMRNERARRIQDWIRDTGCFCTFECAAYNNLVFSPGRWPGLARRLLLRRG